MVFGQLATPDLEGLEGAVSLEGAASNGVSLETWEYIVWHLLWYADGN